MSFAFESRQGTGGNRFNVMDEEKFEIIQGGGGWRETDVLIDRF